MGIGREQKTDGDGDTEWKYRQSWEREGKNLGRDRKWKTSRKRDRGWKPIQSIQTEQRLENRFKKTETGKYQHLRGWKEWIAEQMRELKEWAGKVWAGSASPKLRIESVSVTIRDWLWKTPGEGSRVRHSPRGDRSIEGRHVHTHTHTCTCRSESVGKNIVDG